MHEQPPVDDEDDVCELVAVTLDVAALDVATLDVVFVVCEVDAPVVTVEPPAPVVIVIEK